MAKAKIDINDIRSMISSGMDKKTFIDTVVQKYSVSKNYAIYLYYNNKPKISYQVGQVTSANPSQESSVLSEDSSKESSKESFTPKEVTPDNVKIENTKINEEAPKLKEAYSKLFEEKAGASVEELTKASEEESSEEAFETKEGAEGISEEAAVGEKTYSINLRGLLKQIGVSMNNLLLWKERPLLPEEEENIEIASSDIETKFGDSLVGENSPYYNYLLFTVVAPLIARVDLLPEKIKKFSEWINSRRNASSAAAAAPPVKPATETVVEHPQSAAHPELNNPNLSESQKEWIKNLIAQGYEVYPDFDPNKGVDYEALRDRKIARNAYRG
jgi:hypothetical protein